MGCRGQSYEKQLGTWIAETRTRFSPVPPVLKSSGLLLSNTLTPFHKPWALTASYDASLKGFEFCHPSVVRAAKGLLHPVEKVDEVFVKEWSILHIAHVCGVGDDVKFGSRNLLLHCF